MCIFIYIYIYIYSLKISWNNDDNGYVYHIEIYAGKELDVHHDEGHAFGVVDRLLTESSVYNKGYHLYTDNFYTKPKLAEYLYKHKTLITGTVRVNSKDMPDRIRDRLNVGESNFWRKQDSEMLCLSFREKNHR